MLLSLLSPLLPPMQWEYDNGFGSSVGRFKIDLYMSEGPGDCGTWQTSICDKPERGCKDTSEWRFSISPDPGVRVVPAAVSWASVIHTSRLRQSNCVLRLSTLLDSRSVSVSSW